MLPIILAIAGGYLIADSLNDTKKYARGGGIKRNVFGGNSGYVDYSMSKRASEAYREGKLTYSKLPKWAKKMVDAGIVTTNEWHHTSSWGNKTLFYNVSQFDKLTEEQKNQLGIDEWNFENFKDVPNSVIKIYDDLTKTKLNSKSFVKKLREKYKNQAEENLNNYLKKFKSFERVNTKPSNWFVIQKEEMNGKSGWFRSESKYYNLPIYYTGVDLETQENYQTYINLYKELVDADYNPIYTLQLQEIGFSNEQINTLTMLLKIDKFDTNYFFDENLINSIILNKEIIVEQLNQIENLPKDDDVFTPIKFYGDVRADEFLTQKQIDDRANKHQYISEQGENYGSSRDRFEAHKAIDENYFEMAKNNWIKKVEEYTNDETGKQEFDKFTENKKMRKELENNLLSLLKI